MLLSVKSLFLLLQEFRWRTIAAVAWMMILLPVTLFVFSVAASVDFFHPIIWITGIHLLYIELLYDHLVSVSSLFG